ncbi:MAG TPA: hypothetical protein VK211_25125 [Kamptonema sp.]|nr:hypothetical protein [Kamptonema sp.]
MKPFKRLPTSIGHLAVRLRTWTQPTLWIPMAVFCAGGVLIWAVAVHPEWLSIEEENIADSNTSAQNGALSAEDKMIAADIDTVPVLVDQLNRSNASAGLLNKSVIPTRGLYNELRDRGPVAPKPDPSATASLANAPFALPNSEIPTLPIPGNNNSLNFNSGANLNPKTAAGGFPTNYSYPTPANSPSDANTLNYGKPSPNPQPVSELQTAIENYRKANSPTQTTNPETSSFQPTVTPALSANQPQFSNSPTTSPNVFPGLNPSIPTTTITPNNQGQINPLNNPYQNSQPNNPYQTNLSGSSPVPEIQPVAPSAPTATVPGIGSVSPNNFGQSSFSSPIQGSKVIDSGTQNSGNVGFPTVPQAQPNFGVAPGQVNQTLQPNSPIDGSSVPRQIPGRYIGGGEINTFANP